MDLRLGKGYILTIKTRYISIYMYQTQNHVGIQQ